MIHDIPHRPEENIHAAIDKIPMTRTQAELYYVKDWKKYYDRFIDKNGDFIREFIEADQNIMILPLIYDFQGKAQTFNWNKLLGVCAVPSTNEGREVFIASMIKKSNRWMIECRKHSHGELIISLCRDICSGQKTPRQARNERGLHNNRVTKLLLLGLNKWCIANGLGNFEIF